MAVNTGGPLESIVENAAGLQPDQPVYLLNLLGFWMVLNGYGMLWYVMVICKLFQVHKGDIVGTKETGYLRPQDPKAWPWLGRADLRDGCGCYLFHPWG